MTGAAQISNMIPPIQRVCPNPVPPPSTTTTTDDPSEPYEFPGPPLLKIIVEWHSIAE
jgi:hypothetical protein